MYYDDDVRCRWETAHISLDNLRFDEDFNVYYFDYPAACYRCNLMVEEELQRRAINEKRNRVCNKIEPILMNIRRRHNNNAQYFNDIQDDLNNLDEYEVEVFREEFQNENKGFDNLIPLLDKASDKESAYYQFFFSSPQIGIDFSKFEEKTLLMSILENKELRIGVVIGLFENGYQLSDQDKSYIKETKPTKGNYDYTQTSWFLFWWNSIKDKKKSPGKNRGSIPHVPCRLHYNLHERAGGSPKFCFAASNVRPKPGGLQSADSNRHPLEEMWV